MVQKAARIWFLIAALCVLAIGTACTPIVAGNDRSPTGEADAPYVDQSEGDSGDVARQDGKSINAAVDEIELLLMESFPIQVQAIVQGYLPDGCSVLDGISASRNGSVFTLHVSAHREGQMCTMAIVRFEERVILDVEGLEAGTYQVVAGDAAAEFTFDVDNGPMGDTSLETVRDLRGTVTRIVTGADGIQVALNDGETEYSVTISVSKRRFLAASNRLKNKRKSWSLVRSSPAWSRR